MKHSVPIHIEESSNSRWRQRWSVAPLMHFSQIKPGKIKVQAPANIAVVKYWGKKEQQLPCNPSLSMTLKKSITIMELEYAHIATSATATALAVAEKKNIHLEFTFDGQSNEQFAQKMQQYLSSMVDMLPYLAQLQLKIHARNTFPHSCGIASSASSMCALAFLLIELEKKIYPVSQHLPAEEERHKLSFLARLASGSACRSAYGGWTLWGHLPQKEIGSDFFATPLQGEKWVHPLFKDVQDAILIVAAGTKEFSSRQGHALMEQHPFASVRYALATENMYKVLQAQSCGDWDTWGTILETEALQLHALMMTSHPSFILLKPNSLAIIDKVRRFRQRSGKHVYFTVDAGPNIHLLYPAQHSEAVEEFIKLELLMHCEKRQWILDQLGEGPSCLPINNNE